MSIRVGIRGMGRALGKVKPLSWEKTCIITSTYSLCSTLPFTRLTVSLTSVYVLSGPVEEYLTVSLTSTYSLSTAVT